MNAGISLYPDFMDEAALDRYVREAADLGFRHVFLSLILEELHFAGAAGPDSPVFDRAMARCHAAGMTVTADINPQVMEGFGSPEAAVADLKRRGVDILRADSALDQAVLTALAGAGMGIELNAADLDASTPEGRSQADGEIRRLLASLPAGMVRACFNFYPRTGSGLSLDRVRQSTAFLHAYGIHTAAFVASMTAAPVLHAHGRGVCTAECLRDVPPEAAAAVLRCCGVDEVLLGDLSASPAELSALAACCREEVFSLPVVFCRDCPEELRAQLTRVKLSNREDAPEYILRATATRGVSVPPFRTGPRPRFSVTADNSRSAQYQGEIQIMLRDMPPCEEASVIGFVHPDAHVLLPFLTDHRLAFRLAPYPGVQAADGPA